MTTTTNGNPPAANGAAPSSAPTMPETPAFLKRTADPNNPPPPPRSAGRPVPTLAVNNRPQGAKASAPAPEPKAPTMAAAIAPQPAQAPAKPTPTKGKDGPPAPDKRPAASEPKAEQVGDLSAVDLRSDLLLAALLCASKDAARPYMAGIHIHAHNGKARIVGTDGHRMLVCETEIENEKAPAWLERGVTIPGERLKQRLALLVGEAGDPVRFAFADKARRIELSDLDGLTTFRLLPIDGTFPTYQKIIDAATDAFHSGERSDFSSTLLMPTMLKGCTEIAKALDAERVRVFTGDPSANGPIVLTFPDKPGAVLYVMPAQAKNGTDILPTETRAIVGGAISGTIAALKAHATRWREAAKKAANDKLRAEAQARVTDYEARIEAAQRMARTGLPAPKAEPAKALPAPTPATPKAEPAKAAPAPKAAPRPASAPLGRPKRSAKARAKLRKGR